jgi:hypothetical protein
MKKYHDCGVEKNFICFYSYELSKKTGRCKECLIQRSRSYIAKHKDSKKKADKEYRDKNKEKLKCKKSIYVTNNKQIIKQRQKQWYLKNRNRILQERMEYRLTHKKERNIQDKIRKINDPVYRLRTNMSKLISYKLKKAGTSKQYSITKYLEYTINELKRHLELLFDKWMNWSNYGRYKSTTWDDNDQTTWTWNIDHIIPQSKLPYSSMQDDNFKKCWSLDNLRPLSAKINVMAGVALSKKRGSF